MTRAPITPFALVLSLILAAGCSDSKDETAGPDLSALPNIPPVVDLPRETPDGELIPESLVTARPSSGEGVAAKPEPDATTASELLQSARKAFAEKRYDDAVAITDVLAIIAPGETEALEIRGRSLVAQGDGEGGRADLSACCAKGREECCSRAP